VAVANRQLGLLTRDQLRACGLPPSTISRWVKAGLLHRLHPRVYVLGHTAMAPLGAELAAQLACGAGALISHRSAACLWGLIGDRPAVVDVTLVGRQCRPKSGICLHRSTRVDEREVRHKGPVRVTSPARTLIDLALEVSSEELERLVAEARVRRLLRAGELEKALARSGRRGGAGRLRARLRAEGEPGLTRSGGERLMRRLLRAAGLPQPLTNTRIAGYEVDFLWPAEKVVIEVDSWQFHGHRRAFESDRRKSMALEAAGYHVIRITAKQLRDESLLVIAHIARALDRGARNADRGARGRG
jgi:very-short-patch-repair endonuclease